jgi:hypothetical protein
MTRGMRQRIEKLEGERGSQGSPHAIGPSARSPRATFRCARTPLNVGWRSVWPMSPSEVTRCFTMEAGATP